MPFENPMNNSAINSTINSTTVVELADASSLSLEFIPKFTYLCRYYLVHFLCTWKKYGF